MRTLRLLTVIVTFAGTACSVGTNASIAYTQTPLDPIVGPAPEIFGPGVISGPENDGSPTFSPDGQTLYFTRSAAH